MPFTITAGKFVLCIYTPTVHTPVWAFSVPAADVTSTIQLQERNLSLWRRKTTTDYPLLSHLFTRPSSAVGGCDERGQCRWETVEWKKGKEWERWVENECFPVPATQTVGLMTSALAAVLHAPSLSAITINFESTLPSPSSLRFLPVVFYVYLAWSFVWLLLFFFTFSCGLRNRDLSYNDVQWKIWRKVEVCFQPGCNPFWLNGFKASTS